MAASNVWQWVFFYLDWALSCFIQALDCRLMEESGASDSGRHSMVLEYCRGLPLYENCMAGGASATEDEVATQVSFFWFPHPPFQRVCNTFALCSICAELLFNW